MRKSNHSWRLSVAIAVTALLTGCAPSQPVPDLSKPGQPSLVPVSPRSINTPPATEAAQHQGTEEQARPDPLGTWQNNAYPDFSLTLADDGRADVQLGCNRGGLQWVMAHSDAIVFNGLMTTEMGCDTGQPDNVVLSGATLIDSRTLALLDASGSPVFELTKQD